MLMYNTCLWDTGDGISGLRRFRLNCLPWIVLKLKFHRVGVQICKFSCQFEIPFPKEFDDDHYYTNATYLHEIIFEI